MVAAITRMSTSDRLGRADALDLAVLEHAQQLHLHAERQLADLVEEDRAAVGRLEEPLRSRSAPVNAPRTWPKSSLSSSVGASVVQLQMTNGLVARAATGRGARARPSSLPVPLSPVISAVVG